MARPGLGAPASEAEQRPQSEEPRASSANDDEEEEDYMSMAIVEPSKEKETYSQRRARKQREAEDRARPPSKQALQEAAATARDEGLATALDTSSRGFRMLAKLGFQPGSGLGPRRETSTRADSSASTAAAKDATPGAAEKPAPEGPRLEPLLVDVKADRGGIGLDDERKRKVRDAAGAERVAKKARVEESGVEFRERVAREREEKRRISMIAGAMRVAERMDEESAEPPTAIDGSKKTKSQARPKPLRAVNLLYRSLERDRRVTERDRRMRHDMMQSLPTNRAYDDPDEDEQDRMALGKDVEELDGEESDEELDAFEALEPEERLAKLTAYLREKHWYCFWCKCAYESEEMEGCPGEKEEDHD